MDKKAKISWGVVFASMSVWLSTKAGGGFITGTQMSQYFTKYGWTAIFTPVIWVLLVCLVFRELFLMANHHRVYNYHYLTPYMYGKANVVLGPLYGVCTIVGAILGISSCIAGAGSVLQQTIGLSYAASIIVVGVIILLLSMYGANVVRKSASIMTVIIIICVLIMSIFGITSGHVNLERVVAEKEMTAGWGEIIWKMIVFTGFQCFAFFGILATFGEVKTDKEVNAIFWAEFIVEGILTLLACLLILSYFPETNEEAVPLLYAVNQTGKGWLTVFYSLAMFMCAITTAVSIVFGTITRFSSYKDKFSFIKTDRMFGAIIGIIFIIGSVAVSSFGLIKILKVGYGYTGIIGVFLVLIPSLTIVAYNNRKWKKEHPDFE